MKHSETFISMLNLDFCPVDEVLASRKSLRRTLAAAGGLHDIRVAVLGGSTTSEVVNFLELLLLFHGFRPVFHQSEYGRFYEDAVLDPQPLIDFRPDLIYIHTSCRNLQSTPPLDCSEADLPRYVETELARYRQMWDSLESALGCQIIQNNFELPPHALLGNLDAVAPGGLSRFITQLNLAFAAEIARRPRVLLQDVHGISARMGLKQWFDWDRYFSYKILLTPEANLELARSLAAMVRAIYGRTKKALVLDLDNTLWGGVIGDDGADRIRMGRETAVGEAYTEFQQYCAALRSRGVLLAVCTKNNEDVALSGINHPSSLLRPEHFSCVKANWEPKHENIAAIAGELNLGVDSFVFVDDNPAERALVAAQLPSVAVPNVGGNVTHYAALIEQGRYFEPVALSGEDLQRSALYTVNAQRAALQTAFADYGEYLDSLEMTAEIDAFKPVFIERITQLTNKTNQFNLTTRRYILSEMQSIMDDPGFVGLYGRLADRFGDNGLVSVVLGRREQTNLHLELWLMSCRVLKRHMEDAMLDNLVARAKSMGITAIIGYYAPTPKNRMVAGFYSGMGFVPSKLVNDLPDGPSAWELDVTSYVNRNKHVKVENCSTDSAAANSAVTNSSTDPRRAA